MKNDDDQINSYEDEGENYTKGTVADFMKMLRYWRTIHEMAAMTCLTPRTISSYLRLFETWPNIIVERRNVKLGDRGYPRHRLEYRIIVKQKPPAFRL